jgi:hypothetical protein
MLSCPSVQFEIQAGLFAHSSVAFGDRGFRLLQAAGGFRCLWPPVFPASDILLKLEPGPAIVAVGEEHLPVELIEIGSRFRRGEGRIPHRKQPGAEPFTPLNEDRGCVRFALLKSRLGFTVYARQLGHRLTVPGFRDRIAWCLLPRHRRGTAPDQ